MKLAQEEEIAHFELNFAQSKFFMQAGFKIIVDKIILTKIFKEIGPFLFDFVDGKLSDEQKSVVAHKIKQFMENGPNNSKCKDLVTVLYLDQFVFQNTLITVNSDRCSCTI